MTFGTIEMKKDFLFEYHHQIFTIEWDYKKLRHK